MARSTEPSLTSRRGRPWEWITDLLLVAGFVAVILHPLVFTAQSLNANADWRDLNTLTQPTLTYTGQALAKGELPLWNPYWFAGYPHMAMPSAGVFYPTTILFGFFSFEVAVKIVVLLHCYLAGAFSYLLGRNTFGRRLPALYLAFTAIAGDLVIPAVRASHVWSLQTLAWFPLAFLFVDRVCRGRGWGSALGLSLTVALMIFGGDPQACAFGLYFLAAYTVAFFIIARFSGRLALRDVLLRGPVAGVAVALGLAIAAIQLIPSRELFAESVRAHGVSYEHVSFFLEPKAKVVESWLKDDDHWKASAATRTTIALALAGLLFARRAAAWPVFLAAAPCVLYAFMPRWFFDAVIQHLPVYNGVRGSIRMAAVAWWAVAYLGAFGMAEWTSGAAPDRARRGWMAAVTLAALAVMTALPALLGDPLPIGRLMACAAGILGVIVALAARGRPRVWLAGAGVLIAAATFELAWKVNTADNWGGDNFYRVNPEFETFSASRKDMDRVALVFNPFALRHGAAVGMLTGDRVLQGYHGLVLARYARILDEVGGIHLAPLDARGRLRDTQNFPDDWISPKMLPLIDLFNVRYIVRVNRRAGFSSLAPWQAQRFKQIADGEVDVYENSSVLPPVYAIHDVIVCANDEDAIALLRAGRVDIRKQITVTGAFDGAGLSAPTAPEPITIREYLPERIVVDVDLSTPAVVVFSEMFYPGWHVFVDGVERDILCVNTAFRGVRVEAGRHTIEMRYAPASLRIGAAVSGGSVLIVLAISMGVLLHSRRRARSESAVTSA